MRFRRRIGVRRALLGASLFLEALAPLRAQQPSVDQKSGAASLYSEPQREGDAGTPGKTEGPEKQAPTAITGPAPAVHRFWDRENDLWFAAVGASRALDYASTLNLRRRGINEAVLTNSIVDNRPLFAGIEAAATGVSIGFSYIFHRTGHHRLERWTSIVHFGVATGGAIRNYALETPDHP